MMTFGYIILSFIDISFYEWINETIFVNVLVGRNSSCGRQNGEGSKERSCSMTYNCPLSVIVQSHTKKITVFGVY